MSTKPFALTVTVFQVVSSHHLDFLKIMKTTLTWLGSLKFPLDKGFKSDFWNLMLKIVLHACKLFFTFIFELNSHFFCYSCDSLTFYNGDSSASPLIGHYCGTLLPPNFISSSNKTLIHFKTDESTKRTGFKLEYKAIIGKLVELHAGLCLCWKIMEYLPNSLKI